MAADPIESQVLVLTAAKASVAPTRLPTLIDRAQAELGPELERYRREYERIHEDDERAVFLVEWGHWEDLEDRLDVSARERSAIRRAHEEQLLRIGRREDREEEFETALEIRDPVVIGLESTDADPESDADGSDGDADPESADEP
ncbi:hypothetical protein ACFQGT_17025 [Natrialbaceae archaeon GCM10025810]|uniref:hypothetical protein n=1 Tax=Halovalidus salilacus TaxID=3075124 RepID=UPI00361BA445